MRIRGYEERTSVDLYGDVYQEVARLVFLVVLVVVLCYLYFR